MSQGRMPVVLEHEYHCNHVRCGTVEYIVKG